MILGRHVEKLVITSPSLLRNVTGGRRLCRPLTLGQTEPQAESRAKNPADNGEDFDGLGGHLRTEGRTGILDATHEIIALKGKSATCRRRFGSKTKALRQSV